MLGEIVRIYLILNKGARVISQREISFNEYLLLAVLARNEWEL